MKLFLTGASGLLGSNVARVAARRGHEVVAVIGRWPGPIPDVTHVQRIDLADAAAVQRVVLDLFPDAIVNCAAISSPDQCEVEPERTRQLNVVLPQTLAQLAHHLGARLVHLSSEQVFDGAATTAYRHDDPVNPPNEYGCQKVESERRVLRAAPDNAVVVRLPLLGGNSLTGRRSFHERFFADWSAGQPTRVYQDEIRQPCSAENAAEVLVELIERSDIRGTTHWAGRDSFTRVELAEHVATHFKLNPGKWTQRGVRADHSGGAARQPCLRLDCAPLAGKLRTRLETMPELLEKLVVPPPARAWFASLPQD